MSGMSDQSSTLKATMKSALIAGVAFVGTAAALLSAGVGDQAAAQAFGGHNSNAPVDFAADSIELQSRADRVAFIGNVVIRQAGLQINAPRVTIAYSDASKVTVHRMDASGGVRVMRGDQNARGDVAIYDLDRRIITFVGNVQLSEGANRLSGQRLVMDLNSGRTNLGSGGAPVQSSDGTVVQGQGGRVTGTFNVPKRD